MQFFLMNIFYGCHARWAICLASQWTKNSPCADKICHFSQLARHCNSFLTYLKLRNMKSKEFYPHMVSFLPHKPMSKWLTRQIAHCVRQPLDKTLNCCITIIFDIFKLYYPSFLSFFLITGLYTIVRLN